jgi:hypothetical protein
MRNYHKYYNSWQHYVKSDLQIEQEFNRELNILLKELQVLQEQNLFGSVAQKIGDFAKKQFNKVFDLIKSAPQQAIKLVTSIVQSASKFIKDPENQKKIIKAIKIVGTLALIAIAVGSPAAHAAVVDPDTQQVVGGSGNAEIANMFRGALSNISGALEYMSIRDIDPYAAKAQEQIMQLISKINSSQVIDMSENEKYLFRIAKELLKMLGQSDKTKGTDFLKIMSDIGSQFSDFIIQKSQTLASGGKDIEYTGTLPVRSFHGTKDAAKQAAGAISDFYKTIPK